MSIRRKETESKKVKIGTILNGAIVDTLKERAMREGKPINAIIEEAILRSDQSGLLDRDVRLKALDSFLATRFNLADEDWNAIMEEDYYEQ